MYAKLKYNKYIFKLIKVKTHCMTHFSFTRTMSCCTHRNWKKRRKEGRKREKRKEKERKKERKKDIYIYIYIERERERERENINKNTKVMLRKAQALPFSLILSFLHQDVHSWAAIDKEIRTLHISFYPMLRLTPARSLSANTSFSLFPRDVNSRFHKHADPLTFSFPTFTRNSR